jgi:hypothetical protein
MQLVRLHTENNYVNNFGIIVFLQTEVIAIDVDTANLSEIADISTATEMFVTFSKVQHWSFSLWRHKFDITVTHGCVSRSYQVGTNNKL